MRIAITGASGFIGSHLVRHAADAGHEVIALVRDTARAEHIADHVQRFVVGQHDEDATLADLLDGAEAVIHNSFDWEAMRSGDIGRHYRSNLVGSLELLDRSAPRPFVFISTIATHHDILPQWDGKPDETHPLRPSSHYGAYKAAVEAHLWSHHFGGGPTERVPGADTPTGRHTAAIRPCAVYGPKFTDRHRVHGEDVIRAVVAGEPMPRSGGGKFIHVHDVARASIAALTEPNAAGQPFNLVDCYARYADWAQMTADILGKDYAIDDDSPAQPKNMFTKDQTAGVLGVPMDRGHAGIREHIEQVLAQLGATA